MFENLERSKYSGGYDPQFKEDATVMLMDAIEDAFLSGYKQSSIVKYLSDDLGIKSIPGKTITGKVWKNIMSKNRKREEGMKEKNIQRLEFLYAESVQSGDIKNAISAVDKLNQLCQLYKEKVEITKNEFEFKLGDAKE